MAAGSPAGAAGTSVGMTSATPGSSIQLTASAKGSPYNIGFILASSGEAAFVGQETTQGAQLAINDINKAGGVNGHPLKGTFLDSQLSATVAATDLNKLQSDGVKFLVTQASPVVDALKPLVAEDKILTMNQAATDPSIADAQGYMFTNIANADQEAQALATYMTTTDHIKSVGFLVDDTSIGASAQSALTQQLTKEGVAIRGKQTYEQGATDYRSQLVALQSAHPAAIFMDDTGPSATVAILQQAKALGIHVPFFSNTFFESSTLPSLGGSIINGVTYSYVGFNPTQNSVSEQVQKEWNASGQTGAVPIYAATGYDAVKLEAYAMSKNGYNPTASIKTLSSLKNFQGATGALTFNRQGQVSMPVEIKKVVNEKFVIVKP
jgi:branched-chain amino acid transport system substrate-binding protein